MLFRRRSGGGGTAPFYRPKKGEKACTCREHTASSPPQFSQVGVFQNPTPRPALLDPPLLLCLRIQHSQKCTQFSDAMSITPVRCCSCRATGASIEGLCHQLWSVSQYLGWSLVAVRQRPESWVLFRNIATPCLHGPSVAHVSVV